MQGQSLLWPEADDFILCAEDRSTHGEYDRVFVSRMIILPEPALMTNMPLASGGIRASTMRIALARRALRILSATQPRNTSRVHKPECVRARITVRRNYIPGARLLA